MIQVEVETGDDFGEQQLGETSLDVDLSVEPELTEVTEATGDQSPQRTDDFSTPPPEPIEEAKKDEEEPALTITPLESAPESPMLSPTVEIEPPTENKADDEPLKSPTLAQAESGQSKDELATNADEQEISVDEVAPTEERTEDQVPQIEEDKAADANMTTSMEGIEDIPPEAEAKADGDQAPAENGAAPEATTEEAPKEEAPAAPAEAEAPAEPAVNGVAEAEAEVAAEDSPASPKKNKPPNLILDGTVAEPPPASPGTKTPAEAATPGAKGSVPPTPKSAAKTATPPPATPKSTKAITPPATPKSAKATPPATPAADVPATPAESIPPATPVAEAPKEPTPPPPKEPTPPPPKEPTPPPPKEPTPPPPKEPTPPPPKEPTPPPPKEPTPPPPKEPTPPPTKEPTPPPPKQPTPPATPVKAEPTPPPTPKTPVKKDPTPPATPKTPKSPAKFDAEPPATPKTPRTPKKYDSPKNSDIKVTVTPPVKDVKKSKTPTPKETTPAKEEVEVVVVEEEIEAEAAPPPAEEAPKVEEAPAEEPAPAEPVVEPSAEQEAPPVEEPATVEEPMVQEVISYDMSANAEVTLGDAAEASKPEPVKVASPPPAARSYSPPKESQARTRDVNVSYAPPKSAIGSTDDPSKMPKYASFSSYNTPDPAPKSTYASAYQMPSSQQYNPPAYDSSSYRKPASNYTSTFDHSVATSGFSQSLYSADRYFSRSRSRTRQSGASPRWRGLSAPQSRSSSRLALSGYDNLISASRSSSAAPSRQGSFASFYDYATTTQNNLQRMSSSTDVLSSALTRLGSRSSIYGGEPYDHSPYSSYAMSHSYHQSYQPINYEKAYSRVSNYTRPQVESKSTYYGSSYSPYSTAHYDTIGMRSSRAHTSTYYRPRPQSHWSSTYTIPDYRTPRYSSSYHAPTNFSGSYSKYRIMGYY